MEIDNALETSDMIAAEVPQESLMVVEKPSSDRGDRSGRDPQCAGTYVVACAALTGGTITGASGFGSGRDYSSGNSRGPPATRGSGSRPETCTGVFPPPLPLHPPPAPPPPNSTSCTPPPQYPPHPPHIIVDIPTSFCQPSAHPPISVWSVPRHRVLHLMSQVRIFFASALSAVKGAVEWCDTCLYNHERSSSRWPHHSSVPAEPKQRGAYQPLLHRDYYYNQQQEVELHQFPPHEHQQFLSHQQSQYQHQVWHEQQPNEMEPHTAALQGGSAYASNVLAQRQQHQQFLPRQQDQYKNQLRQERHVGPGQHHRVPLSAVVGETPRERAQDQVQQKEEILLLLQPAGLQMLVPSQMQMVAAHHEPSKESAQSLIDASTSSIIRGSSADGATTANPLAGPVGFSAHSAETRPAQAAAGATGAGAGASAGAAVGDAATTTAAVPGTKVAGAEVAAGPTWRPSPQHHIPSPPTVVDRHTVWEQGTGACMSPSQPGRMSAMPYSPGRKEEVKRREALKEGWDPQDLIRQFAAGTCFWLGGKGGRGEGRGGKGGGCRVVLLQGDITKWCINGKTDAIVNAANERMLGGGGVDGAIHRAAGPELYSLCRRVKEVEPGVRCPTGSAVVTGAAYLPVAHVVHAVGPVFHGFQHSAPLLRQAYMSSLDKARQHGITHIAFPAISSGIFGYPPAAASRTALQCMQHFVHTHSSALQEVHVVLFNNSMFRVWHDKAEELGLLRLPMRTRA